MREDGRRHGHHDDDPSPVAATIFAIVVPVVVAWLLAGRPAVGLF